MSGLTRCGFRLTAGCVGVLATLALIAAPAAWANNGTITAQATVQFAGPVDSPTSCNAPTAATIDWGDSTATSTGTITRSGSSYSVSGTHTYATQGTYDGTVTLSGGSCGSVGSPTEDSFTANVSQAPPMFTQCPAVDENNGCQFLITIGNGSETVAQDPNEGPYEGSDDSLIGVQNNSSSTIDELPLSVPGSDLFGFDGDGICDVAAPVPSGCVAIAGSPAGSTCGNGATCVFPPAPGQPAADADAYPGSTQNGYEGPSSYFTNISADTSSGVVDFSPGIPPGGSTFFSLEEPPVNTSIGVGGTAPFSPGLAPPTVTATGATFSAFVNPNGSATTAYYQYGLDLRYVKLGESGPDYTNSTSVQSVGSDFADHLVTSTVAGLVPNALYHVRLVATNGGGTTFGPDTTFMTKTLPAPGSPTLGRSFNVSVVKGLVLIKLKGVFVPLTQLRQIPTNTEINALQGSIKIITAVPGGSRSASDAAAKKKGKTKTQNGTFSGAIFKITQARDGLATLSLVESAFKGAPSYSLCTKKKAGDASAASSSTKSLQLLHASAKGKFSTKGRYSAATVLGTKWTIADRCDGTLTHDITDSVKVTDFVHHKTITLHAGQSYLAKKP